MKLLIFHKFKLTKKYVKGKIILGDIMKSKDKTKKQIKIQIKNIICFLAFIISLFCIGVFYNLYFVKNNVFARATGTEAEKIEISNAEPIEIENIINNNSEDDKKEEYLVEEVELEYITKYRNNARLT